MLDALATLAATAGTTVVAAMATDAWQVARAGVARLFGRAAPGTRDAVEAQLDRHEALVAGADEPDRVRQRLAAAWQAELATVLEGDPALAADLTALVEEIQKAVPQTQHAWIVQQVTVSGSGNLTNVVAGGNIIHHGARPPKESDQ